MSHWMSLGYSGWSIAFRNNQTIWFRVLHFPTPCVPALQPLCFYRSPFVAFDSTKRGTESTETYRNPNFLGWETNLKSIILQLVGGFNHLEKYESQWEGLCNIFWKIEFMFQSANQNIITSISKCREITSILHMFISTSAMISAGPACQLR